MQGLGILSSSSGVLKSGTGVTAACDFGRKISNSVSGSWAFVVLDLKISFSYGSLKFSPSILAPPPHSRKSRKSFSVRAAGNYSESSKPIGPLQLESPTGQFLSQLLKEHPHLLPAAVDQQLERLVADRDAAAQEEIPSSTGTEFVLYRRIAELKVVERRKALEEIIYALIVQKFMDARISLIPCISMPDPVTGQIDTWPKQDHKLEGVHSSEAFEMIKNHVALVLGNRLLDSNSIAQISKLQVGQVYATSVMYGYFLRRVDQRFQLEKSMQTLPFGLNEESDAGQPLGGDSKTKGKFQAPYTSPRVASAAMPGIGTPSDPKSNPTVYGRKGVKPCKLRAYVMSFDPETLQGYATMRSKEGVSIIEKHSKALFGRPEVQIVGGSVASTNDEIIKINFSGLTSLVLEAVTFGSFLWDVESYMDSRYHFVTN